MNAISRLLAAIFLCGSSVYADEPSWNFHDGARSKTLGELWDGIAKNGARPALVAVNNKRPVSSLVDGYRTDAHGEPRWILYDKVHGAAAVIAVWVGKDQPTDDEIGERLGIERPTFEQWQFKLSGKPVPMPRLELGPREMGRMAGTAGVDYPFVEDNPPMMMPQFGMPRFGGGMGFMGGGGCPGGG